MHIVVVDLEGNRLSIEAEATDDVKALKHKVHTAGGPTTERQKLIFCGQALVGGERLEKYNIEADTVIHLVIDDTPLAGLQQLQERLDEIRNTPDYDEFEELVAEKKIVKAQIRNLTEQERLKARLEDIRNTPDYDEIPELMQEKKALKAKLKKLQDEQVSRGGASPAHEEENSPSAQRQRQAEVDSIEKRLKEITAIPDFDEDEQLLAEKRHLKARLRELGVAPAATPAATPRSSPRSATTMPPRVRARAPSVDAAARPNDLHIDPIAVRVRSVFGAPVGFVWSVQLRFFHHGPRPLRLLCGDCCFVFFFFFTVCA